MHKRSAVKSLMDRADKIPSSSSERRKEKRHVLHVLEANGYPKHFILDASKRKTTTTQVQQSDEFNSFCTLPYVQGTSEPIKRVLGSFGVNVALKPHKTIGNMFPKPKDPIPKDQIRGLVYSIPCADCDTNYVGETKRQYKTRLGEHQKAVEKGDVKKSALAEHNVETEHEISWDSATIRHTCENWQKRRILEAWEINICKKPLNRDDGMKLPREYLHLALKDKRS